jgi:transglutaminase/protease-like cytokinesis protein 3
MEALGRAAGVEVAYIVGDARHSSASVEGDSHAWNAVRINGRWYLLDATWDAGTVAGDTFTKRYSTDYLLAPPDVFGRDHYPEDPRWQLRVTPISRGEFFRQPMMSAAFYAQGLELLAPDRSQIDARGELAIVVRNPAGMYLSATPDGGARCDASGREVVTLRCRLPERRSYDVTLFSNTTEFGTYHSVGNIAVNNAP